MQAAIIVPKTAHKHDEAVEMALKELTDRYGETHTTDMKKYYTNRAGELVGEPATRVETFGEVHREGGLTMVAERVKEITGLQAVMYVLNNEKTVV